LKPFDPDEALRVVNSAWSSWKLNRVRSRHHAA